MYSEWGADETLYYNKTHEKRIVTVLRYPDWVLKIVRHTDPDGTNNTQELLLLNQMRNDPIRHAIKTPRHLGDAWGLTGTEFWYAMERCSGHIGHQHRALWKEVARAGIEFLSDLHRKHGLLHMDIKRQNILVTYDNKFVVADYELVTRPKTGATCERSQYDRWYYIRYGAEWNQPLACWRMDLTMLGYLLAELLWEGREWQFQRECTRHMEEDEDALYYKDALALRSEEIAKADPTVLSYLAIVAELPWNPWSAPPPVAFYERLLTLFV
jgi:serine/threonine protein kinase